MLRVLRVIAALIARVPATRRLLESDLVRRSKIRAGREIAAETAIAITALLDDAGVAFWLAGGWGVDALVGRQTRKHADLDVVVDDAAPDRIAAALAQRQLNFVTTERSIPPMPTVWVFSDRGGTTVEVMPIDRNAPPFDSSQAFTTGTIDNRSVPCLSASVQRALRDGYRNRKVDRDDLATLDRSEPQ